MWQLLIEPKSYLQVPGPLDFSLLLSTHSLPSVWDDTMSTKAALGNTRILSQCVTEYLGEN